MLELPQLVFVVGRKFIWDRAGHADEVSLEVFSS